MLDDDTKKLVEEIAALAAQPGDGTIGEHPRHHLEVLSLFDRCRGMFGAVRWLARGGFGQEALILTRPMFTESLMLLEIASVDEKRRIELIVGWSLASLADLEGVLREAQARGDDTPQLHATLAGIAKRRAALEAYARDKDARTRHWRPDEKVLADKHRDGDGYLDFRMSHHFVHGTSFASDQRFVQRDDGVVMVGDPSVGGEWDRGAALSAAQSMLYATRGVCAILGWPEPSELERLLERVEAMATV